MRSSTILLALVGSALAVPVDHRYRLEDLQCRCLSYSTDAKPTLCTHMESHAFDFHTASSLASDYDIKIEFASQNTISNILSINRPLPSSVLQSVSQGEVAQELDPKNLLQRENKIVCGLGDEVKRMGSHDGAFEPECHFIGYVLGAFMFITLVYVLIARLCARIIAEEGTIKLEGDEKALIAAYESDPAAQEEDIERAALADGS